MALRHLAETGQAGRITRLAALLMLFLALALGVWRASDLLTGAAPASRNPAESSLMTLIDPIAGPGNARVTITPNAEGGRTFFLLLDAAAAPAAADLQRILPDAAGLDFTGGDKLVIEQVAFARGLPGRPDAAAWLELGALGLISLISAGLALSTLRPSAPPVLAAPKDAPVRSPLEARPETVRPLRAVPAITAPEASDLAQRDPARAAAVLRGWMKTGEDAS